MYCRRCDVLSQRGARVHRRITEHHLHLTVNRVMRKLVMRTYVQTRSHPIRLMTILQVSLRSCFSPALSSSLSRLFRPRALPRTVAARVVRVPCNWTEAEQAQHLEAVVRD